MLRSNLLQRSSPENPRGIRFLSEFSTDEARFIILGSSSVGNLLVVVFTERRDIIRLMSAREPHRRKEKDMKHSIHLLEDDNYDLDDDIVPEYDFAELQERAQSEGREYRGQLRGRVIRLAPDVSDAFQSADEVNEALR
jgi:hypothetical protein